MTREELEEAIVCLEGDNSYNHSAVIDFLERFGIDAVID